jgi:hypothetical protein
METDNVESIRIEQKHTRISSRSLPKWMDYIPINMMEVESYRFQEVNSIHCSYLIMGKYGDVGETIHIHLD